MAAEYCPVCRTIHHEPCPPGPDPAPAIEGPTCLYFSAIELAEGAPLCGHGSCYAIIETSHDDSADCETHGATYVTEYGSNSGFAGEGVYWWVLACGCTGMECGSYDGR